MQEGMLAAEEVMLAAEKVFFFFFLGYRGIVHPPSDDGGTERTWFVPEHRPRKQALLLAYVVGSHDWL